MPDEPFVLRVLGFVVNITDPSKLEELFALEEEFANIVSELEKVNHALSEAKGGIRSLGAILNETGDLTLKDVLQNETIPLSSTESELLNRLTHQTNELEALYLKRLMLYSRKSELVRRRFELLRAAVHYRLG